MMTTETSQTTELAIHVFEKAGLGKAPFRVLGATYSVGPITTVINGVAIQVGASGQPMGSCDYCGQGIALIVRVRGADGREFNVGCDCAERSGDRGMIVRAKREKAKLAREKRHAREAARLADLEAMLTDETTRAQIATHPHPRGYMNRETGEPLTLLDWAEWMVRCSGAKGKGEVLKTLRATLA